MKHNLKIIFVLLAMFIITQFIGLVVLKADVFYLEKQNVDGSFSKISNPYLSWIHPPESASPRESLNIFPSIIFAFIFAVVLLFLVTKFKVEFLLKLWFFSVVVIALFLSIVAFEKIVPFGIPLVNAMIFALFVSLFLGFFKIYRQNFLVHNLTELLIYPGIATVFVPLFSLWTIGFLLILISLYDMWAVWHSGIMQKMAKYQIDHLKVFSGFFVPYLSNKMKLKIKRMKAEYKAKKIDFGKKKIKVNVAILGGGDIVFPIITAGVALKMIGIIPALFVIAGATAGLSYLFFFAEKKKFYPAMPFITAGIFLGAIIYWIIF
jgi:presenilin-like A22 family membrane protease